MEILYGTTMAAIFVLCLALLWTARRILQSSPLSSGELSLTHRNKVTHRSELSAEPNFAEIALSYCEPEVTEIDSSLIDPVALEMMASQARMAEPIQVAAQTTEPPPMGVRLTEIAENAEIPALPKAKRGEPMPRPFPRGYKYFLECLLLGVSVVVLVKTQRSTARYRSLLSSDQVA